MLYHGGTIAACIELNPVAMANKKTCDYIIVGAGSAGCVLAGRLSANSATRVLLIEAGGGNGHLLIEMPAAAALAARDSRFGWGYVGEPEPQLGGRRISVPRGKVLGGSSSINGMVANRGNPRDYDGWAADGLDTWSYAHCLHYFKKMETFSRGANAWRGGDGPQYIETCPADHPLDRAFLAAGREAGYAFSEDQNGEYHEGFHVAQSFTHRGKRWSTADGYLSPAQARPNLTLLTRALVHRVIFDGRRAVGVDVEHRGQIERFEAECEVLLAGGAINSPQLLLLSGIGDSSHLGEHGIAVTAELPAVGRHLEDHLIVPIQYAAPRGVSPAHRFKGIGRWQIGLQWLLFKSGLGASTFCETGCFFKSSGNVDYADLQHEFYPVVAQMGEAESNVAEGFMFSMGHMRPESRGRIALKSTDPRCQPSIVFNYLDTRGDRQAMIDGLRLTREMAAQSAFDKLRGAELSPGPDVRSDVEILTWLAAEGTSEFHPCSTCRMGSGDDSVTDGEGRVHGVDGLRVVDASIMPHNVTANLNAPVIMIAEKIADLIAGKPTPRL